MAKFQFQIKLTHFEHSGETITLAQENWFVLAGKRDEITAIDETIVVAEVTDKKVSAAWDAACAIDIPAKMAEIGFNKSAYPKENYFINAAWARVA